MTRKTLLASLQQYKADDAEEDKHRQAIIGLLQDDNCFERSRLEGHITASAWIISPDSAKVLLLHHSKLDRWLQPGGHADGDEDVARVALREAQEETGLTSLKATSQEIFDLDVHLIPARKDEPEHFHYDIRFLLSACPDEPISHNHESKAVAWVHLNEAAERCRNEASIVRLVKKTCRMRNLLTVA